MPTRALLFFIFCHVPTVFPMCPGDGHPVAHRGDVQFSKETTMNNQKNSNSTNGTDSRVHQFSFDFIVTENISIKEIEKRIINQLCNEGIDGVAVVGNPGLTDASWSKSEYGL